MYASDWTSAKAYWAFNAAVTASQPRRDAPLQLRPRYPPGRDAVASHRQHAHVVVEAGAGAEEQAPTVGLAPATRVGVAPQVGSYQRGVGVKINREHATVAERLTAADRRPLPGADQRCVVALAPVSRVRDHCRGERIAGRIVLDDPVEHAAPDRHARVETCARRDAKIRARRTAPSRSPSRGRRTRRCRSASPPARTARRRSSSPGPAARRRTGARGESWPRR